MIVEVDGQEGTQPLAVDLCIVGAGAAGIAMARYFAGKPVQVAVLESGAYRYEAEVQDLYRGENVGIPYFALHECRSRRFGGSTNCWGGMCTPITDIDFQSRSWVPDSGWPYGAAELEPHMRQAHDLCGIGPYGYDETVWDMLGDKGLPFDKHLLWSHFWQMNSRYGKRQVRFAKKFHGDLKTASNVRVLLNANVVDLELDEHKQRLISVKFRGRNGVDRQVFAKTFVLACGGIENARLLLNADSQRQGGIGNDHDLVGRYFQEHLQAPCAIVTPSSPDALIQYARWYPFGRTYARPGITLSPSAQQQCQTLNASVSVDPIYDERYLWTAAKKVWDDLVARSVTTTTVKNVARCIQQSPTFFPDAYRRLRYGARPMGTPVQYTLYARAEQSPNFRSRVRLSDTRDRLGLRRVMLDWQTTALDHRAVNTLVDAMEQECTRLNLGKVEPLEWVRANQWPKNLVGGPHHMGTTRMSDDPRRGVVDRNAKVHGVESLYIAGSSIFPTGGHANSTLTLLATTLRLCDHLNTQFAAGA